MMSNQAERLQILEMIDQGIISAEEGFKLLQALGDDSDEDVSLPAGEQDAALSQDEQTFQQPESPSPEQVNRWKRWWVIPLYVGIAVTVLGGALMYWAWQSTGFSFWFACTWVPFLLGVAVLALAWGSQKSPWLHVRVDQAPGQKPKRIAFSFPLPLRLTVWFLRTFGHFIPKLDATPVDEIIVLLDEVAVQEEPFFITVDEDEDGERVQIFIG